MANLLFHATLITTAIILTAPFLFSHNPNTANITSTMKLATMVSTLPLILFTSTGMQSITTNLSWVNMNFNLQISFTFDTYAVLFLPVALLITWSILEFTTWYMASDPNHYKFSKYLLLFLIAMLTLTTANNMLPLCEEIGEKAWRELIHNNNMLQLFIGWEGVGIMSFLLISWWHARTNANTAALQAIIYNRIGDIGLILSITWLAMNFDTWEMQQMFAHSTVPATPLLGLILAAAGKSAQFGLHPWLPAAMEGPTPVSALLHSSTMVVAGVFLLIRFHPLLEASPVALSSCLCLGALTTTFAALCALTQNDIKKIIAFSTTSQLGLMMLTIGLNQPELAFLHITTHAFFKAMLFLCSGSIIHNLGDEQDIRKMGGVQKTMPITTSCTTLGSLALMGAPFLAGFYTKDLIIETMNTSTLNAWALLTTIMATTLTAAYSLRLVFYVQLNTPRYLPWNRPNEAHSCQVSPILRLAAGSILMGLLVTSIILPNKTQTMTMTTMMKLCASMVTLLGLICALDLAQQTTQMKPQNKTISHTTVTQLMFFNTIFHRTSPKMNLTLAQLSLLSNDTLWYETVGPMMVKKTNMTLASKLSSTNTTTIKTYLTSFITTTTVILLWLKLYGTR